MTVETQMCNGLASPVTYAGEAIGLGLTLAQPTVEPIAVTPTIKFIQDGIGEGWDSNPTTAKP